MQPEFVKRNVIFGWMLHAWGLGDKTVELYNGGKPFFEPYVTYHEDTKEG